MRQTKYHNRKDKVNVMKITTKTKKAELVKEVISRGLMTEEEANAKNRIMLLELLHSSKTDENFTDNTPNETENVDISSKTENDDDNKSVEVETPKKTKKLPRKKDTRSFQEQLKDVSKKLDMDEKSMLDEMDMKEEKITTQNTKDNFKYENVSEDVKKSDDKTVDIDDEEKSELKAQAEIIATMISLKESVDELKSTVHKREKRISYMEEKIGCAYELLATFMNKIASTCDSDYLSLYNKMYDIMSELKSLVRSDIVVIDMQKLLMDKQEEEKRAKEEEEAMLKLQEEELEAERSYIDGDNICYKDGEVYKADGCSKKKYKVYDEWANFLIEWFDYIEENFGKIEALSSETKRKLETKKLKEEISKDLIGSFEDEEVDDDTIEMVNETIETYYEDNDRERAMAYLIAIVDTMF